MNVISNDTVVVVPVPSINAIDISGTRSLTLGVSIETYQKQE